MTKTPILNMSHTYSPFFGLDEIQTSPLDVKNVSNGERVGSAVAGVALVAYGLSRGGLGGAVLGLIGGALLKRGASGRCEAYRYFGIDTTGTSDGRGVPDGMGVRMEKSIVIQRSPMELSHFWHNLSNLPGILPHVKSVDVNGSRSHWVVEGPAGRLVQWDAEFINEVPGELLAWQSLPGAEVKSAGSVRFEPTQNGDATILKVTLQYLPPGGKAAAALASLLGESPDLQLEEDLARFKETMERGEQ